MLGDEAFPLSTFLMKPYPRRNQLSVSQKVFNYRLSRGRRIVENAFGILSARFRVFKSPIALSTPTVVKLVKSACALHNWIRKMGNDNIIADVEDHERGQIIPGSWRSNNRSEGLVDLRQSMHRNYLAEARQKRDNLANYFIGEGAVSWQYRMID